LQDEEVDIAFMVKKRTTKRSAKMKRNSKCYTKFTITKDQNTHVIGEIPK